MSKAKPEAFSVQSSISMRSVLCLALLVLPVCLRLCESRPMRSPESAAIITIFNFFDNFVHRFVEKIADASDVPLLIFKPFKKVVNILLKLSSSAFMHTPSRYYSEDKDYVMSNE